MPNKFIPNEEQIEFIKSAYRNSDFLQSDVAEALGVSHDTLRRVAKSLGLEKVRKSVWSSEKIMWLKSNYNLTYKEMCEYLGFNEETIRLKINELGLHRTTRYRPFKLDMSDTEFLSDLDNPTLTAPDIVEKYKDKYGVSESRIWQLRKQRRIKLQVDTIHRVSTSESKVKEILDELDVAYIQEKAVGKYHIDFYLGFKLCLEVQGHYWHNKPERKATDIRKKDYLSRLGYKVVYIWDNELEKAKEIIKTALQEQGLPIQ